MLDRIQKTNPRLNAYITVCDEMAMRMAAQAEAEFCVKTKRKSRHDRGPLHGIPISLKDNIYTRDVRTTGGSKILKDFVPLHDAPVVASLKNAGAVILGKTNMHEFAYGVTSGESPFRAHAQPLGHGADCRRIQRRFGSRARSGLVLWQHRHRHGRLDPNPGVTLRRSGAKAGPRSCECCGRDSAFSHIGFRRTAGPQRRRCGASAGSNLCLGKERAQARGWEGSLLTRAAHMRGNSEGILPGGPGSRGGSCV